MAGSSDLIVKPSYIFTENDIITVDKLNLAATPVVELALQDPVNDQNYLRNGNFYSSFWTTPTGMNCPAGVWTSNADYWYARPSDVIAHTTVSTAFVQPATAANVTITVSATGWMSPTQAIWIVGGGDYTVSSITNATTVVVTNTGTAGVNAALGASVPIGAGVSPKNTGVDCLRSGVVPDTSSLFSARLTGAGNVGTVEWGQQISGDLSATLRQNCTFSGYLYNSTGLTISPKLEIYSCTAFNNFNTITLQTTVDLQTSANALWTYVTATVDLSVLVNVANGIWVVMLIPTGLNSASNYVLFSRLKFQIGSIATPFTDDISLFVQTPTIDSTMLQDGCIARPSLFLSNVVPTEAYQDKSVTNPKIADGAVNSRTIAAGTAVANLGYTPVNKAGDAGIGPLITDVDTVSSTGAFSGSGLTVRMSATNSANNGYLPSIGFWRQGTIGRVIGLDTAGKFKTIDSAGGVGFLLDTITKVATADVQDKAITFAKLADSLVALLVAPGTVHAFAGPSPPTGWVICDGHEESRTGSTAALFAAIGTYWGVGNNSTTFNVPNFVNRVPVGYGAGAMWGFGNAAYTPTDLGQVNLALTTAQLPSHTHTITDQQHSHSINAHQHGYVNPIGTSVGVAPGGMSVTQASGVTNTNATQSTMNNSYSNINTTNANGSGAVHNNMPPFAMLYYIIKI